MSYKPDWSREQISQVIYIEPILPTIVTIEQVRAAVHAVLYILKNHLH